MGSYVALVNEEPLSRVAVHLRMRPSAKPSPMIHIDYETATVLVDVEKKSGGGPPRTVVEQVPYTLDSIVETINQQRVYKQCAKVMVEEFLNGYNATILAYGQIGSGKTFTMVGDTKVHVHQGILPRAIAQVFEEKKTHPEVGMVVYMSYMEIYQETMYDLLNQRSNDLTIIEENGLIDVRGLTRPCIETEAQAMKWFLEGEKARTYGNHALNQQSSRSHTIFTLYMERKVGRFPTEHDVTVAKLNLVDLAGVECLKKTNTDTGGLMRREACTINKSLSFLEMAVYTLHLGQGYIPFRQGKASVLLKESLGGNCKTAVIICVWPEECFLDETTNSLRFAQQVRYLKTFPFRNKKLDCATANTRRHLLEIANLQQEVALKDALHGRQGVSMGDLTEEAKNKLRKNIEEFLQNDESLERIPIDNEKQVKEIFCLFKEAQAPLREEYERILREYGILPPPTETPLEDVGVGELTIHGFHVGIAPSFARPHHPQVPQKWNEDEKRCGITMLDYKEEDPLEDVWESGSIVRNDAFKEYKHTNAEGREQEATIKGKLIELKTKKQFARDLCETCNDMRYEILTIKRILNEKLGTKEFEMDIDNNKTNLYKRLKTLKSGYHKTFNEIKLLKDLIERLTKEVRDRKENFLESFYSWFNDYEKQLKVSKNEFINNIFKRIHV